MNSEEDIYIQLTQESIIKEGVGESGRKKAIKKLTTDKLQELSEHFVRLKDAASNAVPKGERFNFQISASVTTGFNWLITASGEGGITLSAGCVGKKT